MRNIFPALLVLSLSPLISMGQDTLPDFSVNNRGNKRILVSWYNKYPLVKQISVQRSDNILTNYKTILTVPDPMNRQNGFMDTRAEHDSMYYRLYILLDGGNFIFSKPQRPFSERTLQMVLEKSKTDSANLTPEEVLILKRYQNNRLEKIEEKISTQMNNTLKEKNGTNVFVPSYRISTNRDGNVRIRLQDYDQKKYRIRFYEDDETFLFELKEIREPFLLVDKANFHHAGWFRFELYEEDTLIEKHKFYIPKDF